MDENSQATSAASAAPTVVKATAENISKPVSPAPTAPSGPTQQQVDTWTALAKPNFAPADQTMSWSLMSLMTFMNHPAAVNQATDLASAKNGDQLPNGDLVIVSDNYIPNGFANLALNFGISMNAIRYYNGIPNHLPARFDVRPGRKIRIPAINVPVPEGK